jgi:Sigma-70 region 2
VHVRNKRGHVGSSLIHLNQEIIALSVSIGAPAPRTIPSDPLVIVSSCPPLSTANVQGRRDMQIDLASAVAEGFRNRRQRPQPSQTELIRSIAHGNRRAMHVLFAQHRLRVYRFALRLVDDKDAAEDLVNEVFLEVWRHAGSFEERCRVSRVPPEACRPGCRHGCFCRIRSSRRRNWHAVQKPLRCGS